MNSLDLARAVRISALRMVAEAKSSHIGSALSLADILAVLYGRVLRHAPDAPDWIDRDRVVLSKGHACSALYAVLAHTGYFPASELSSYGKELSRLMAHASHRVPGVEFSTGSLGHGLPFAVGRALAAKRRNRSWRSFVIVGDGELDEGSNWEALMFAHHHRLDNLVLIIDHNKIQSLGDVDHVLTLGDLPAKLRAFGMDTIEVDGHNHDELFATLADPSVRRGALAVVAHTIKGKGVSFMEGQLRWHYSSPDERQLAAALAELSAVPAAA